MTLKHFFVLTVVLFWLSGWVSVDHGYAFPIALPALAVLVQLGASRVAHRRWPELLLNLCSVLLLLKTILFVLLGLVFKIEAGLEVWLFLDVGALAYVRLLVGILRAQHGQGSRTVVYAAILGSLAIWSWLSAFALNAHRGVDLEGRMSCILKPIGFEYSEELDSLWDMRLPILASFWNSTVDDFELFHAVLFVPGGTPEHYNWSKRHLRFEPIDPANQDAFLPQACP
ncbi:hypothetical protein GG681_11710 [Epibacterium sp. SM1969]|uniref:Uncharacterized protein n=1 Tax=Tritonibacter aquimaris TaxID=2663379 RepID=A0A844AMP8_9RHOB|nr:hypothetical protein [Tritonibacter aquimaris]MQY43309.1 hypothetical protein [Tritonibacter aquimaris]